MLTLEPYGLCSNWFIIGRFGVPRENDNGRRAIDFCSERGLCMGDTYFENKSLYKYTRMTRGQDGAEVKNITDLVLVKNDMLYYDSGGCEGSEMNGMRPLRSPCCAV